ncbi:MAG: polyphosphate polymerase domain-containing protein [Planctomycetales bacterium]|nr:polyphosphate polymerase domain-containing protein [Planctomycetales bacterium]
MDADFISASNSPFQILDRGETRVDLAARTEVKFTLPNADVEKLRSVLVRRCEKQVHNESVSLVHSLYFDDATYSACYANLNGHGRRKKLRLRWYDTVLPANRFYCEVKWRKNRVTGKCRFLLKSSVPVHGMNYRRIWRGLANCLPDEHVPDVVRYCDPVVLVQYKREHFVSRDESLRLTLDYDIQFFDQVGKRLISTRFPKKLNELVVLEGKTPIGREHELRRLISPLAPRTSRCSKYVHGCRALGLVRDD